MSILIKGAEMPESCQKCGLLRHHVGVEYDEYYICGATGEMFNDGYKRKSKVFINPYAERLFSCPLEELPKGKWIKNEGKVGWHCSECKADNNYAYSWNSDTGKEEFQDKYCPNCGAEMRSSAQEADE